MESSAKSGQEPDGIDAAIASSSVQEPAENAIVNAYASTTPRRFSGSPIQGLLPAASPDQPQLRRANTYHSSGGDDHKGGVAAVSHHSMAIRSAT
jgi:hypothetical protein